jgi:hypothetical protein
MATCLHTSLQLLALNFVINLLSQFFDTHFTVISSANLSVKLSWKLARLLGEFVRLAKVRIEAAHASLRFTSSVKKVVVVMEGGWGNKLSRVGEYRLVQALTPSRCNLRASRFQKHLSVSKFILHMATGR